MSRLTICIAAYEPDHGHLSALLESIGTLAEPDVRIIITEDPGSNPLLDPSMLPGDVPVTYVANEERLGMVGNWNKSVSVVDTEYALLVGQDDLLLANAARTHLSILDQHPEVALSASTPAFINSVGKGIATNVKSTGASAIFADDTTYLLPHALHAKLALQYGNITGEPCGSVFRVDCWKRVDGYNPNYQHSADIDFALRMSKLSGFVAYTHTPTSQRRLHESNATWRHIESGLTSQDRHRLFADHSPSLPEPRDHGRARARLITHDAHDAFRTRQLRRLPRLARPFPYRGLLSELSEHAGFLSRVRGDVATNAVCSKKAGLLNEPLAMSREIAAQEGAS